MKHLLIVIFLLFCVSVQGQQAQPSAKRFWRLNDQVKRADAQGNQVESFPYTTVSVRYFSPTLIVVDIGKASEYYRPDQFLNQSGTAYGTTVDQSVNAWTATAPSLGGVTSYTALTDKPTIPTSASTIGGLVALRNLSDLANVATARDNLGLSSAATMAGPSSTIVGINDTQTFANKSISGSSNTFSNIPLSALSGLASGVSTFLVAPTSASLAAAITDETGTGALVFGTSPTINSPTISGNITGSSGALINNYRYSNNNTSFTSNSIGTAGAINMFGGGTQTDNISTSGSTVAHGTSTGVTSSTMASLSAVTYSNASTFYISGPPTAGPNVTLVNPFSFYVASGASLFNGGVILNGVTGLKSNVYRSNGGDMVFNNSGSTTTYGKWFVESTGNLLLQNGGTYTDDLVNRLQVAGSGIVSTSFSVGTNLSVVGNAIAARFYLPTTTSGGDGILYLNTNRFLFGYGTGNTFLGSGSGNLTLTGSNNTIIGNGSGTGITTGSNNIYLGTGITTSTQHTNSILFGNGAGAGESALANTALFGSSASAMNIKSYGNILLGSSTTAGTTSPLYIDFGGMYSSVAGTNLKLLLYNSSGNQFGMGVSSGQFDLVAATGASFSFYVSSTKYFNISSTSTTTQNDVEITDSTKGLILKSANATRWRVAISNAGVLTTTSL